MSVGRYTKVRGWLADRCVTPPMMIDRRRGRNARLFPCVEHSAQYEWDVVKDQVASTLERKRLEAYALYQGRSKPVLAPMRLAGLWGASELFSRIWYMVTPSVTTAALDSNYTAGSAGDVYGARLLTPYAKTLDKVYVFISSFTGTAANVNDINVELRPPNSDGAVIPNNSSLTESKILNPGGVTGWHATTGWSSSLAAASRNFIVVADADGLDQGLGYGVPTDFATMGVRSSGSLTTDEQKFIKFMACLSTGGWASGNSAFGTTTGFLVAVFSDGTVCGQSISASAAPSASANQRGLRIASDALPEAIDVFAVGWTSGSSTNITGGKIYTGTNGPASGEDNISTDLLYGNTTNTKEGWMPSGGGVYRFSPGTQYRCVVYYGGSTASGFAKSSIGTGANADLQKALPGGGKFTWTEQSGGAWVDDSNAMANTILYLDADIETLSYPTIVKRGGTNMRM